MLPSFELLILKIILITVISFFIGWSVNYHKYTNEKWINLIINCLL